MELPNSDIMTQDKKNILAEEIRVLMQECGEEPIRIDNILSSENIHRTSIKDLVKLKSNYLDLKKQYQEAGELKKHVDELSAKPVAEIIEEIDANIDNALSLRFGVKIAKNDRSDK